MNFKYKIYAYLTRLPTHEYRRARAEIIDACQIDRKTLYRYMSIMDGDKQDIPAYKLLTIAAILKVSAYELINYKIKYQTHEKTH